MLQNPVFLALFQGSIYKDPLEALDREFFTGIIEYENAYSINYKVVIKPALTTEQMETRAKDTSFCLSCFKGMDIHYMDCPRSPWNDAINSS